MIDGWSPGLGDLTLLGWITTGAYVLATWLCVRAYAATPARHGTEPARARRFWLMLAVVMAALTVNKQLDLQSLLTAVGRQMARDGNWYDVRRTVQRAFIIAVMSAGAVVPGLMLLQLRGATSWVKLAGLGLTFLVVFIATRAASFHHIDGILRSEWAGVYANHVLELSGIATIALAAAGDRWFK